MIVLVIKSGSVMLATALTSGGWETEQRQPRARICSREHRTILLCKCQSFKTGCINVHTSFSAMPSIIKYMGICSISTGKSFSLNFSGQQWKISVWIFSHFWWRHDRVNCLLNIKANENPVPWEMKTIGLWKSEGNHMITPCLTGKV